MYNVQVLDFHNSTGATHTMNEDGSYTIFVNARLTKERQEIAYWHEIEHIKNEDIQAYLDADSVEFECHRRDGFERRQIQATC